MSCHEHLKPAEKSRVSWGEDVVEVVCFPVRNHSAQLEINKDKCFLI